MSKYKMWVVYRYQPDEPYKIGTSKDDLIEWLLLGYNDDNYAWGYTKAEAIAQAKEIFTGVW